MVIIGISLSIGVPSLEKLMTNNELTSRSNNLVALIQYTRSESIKRGSRVTLCPSATAMNVSPTCLATNNWLPGYLVYLDVSLSGSYVDGVDEILKQVANNVGDAPSITINAEVLRKDDPVTITNYISFVSPRGEPLDAGGNNQSGTFKICEISDTSKVRGIKVDPSGRVFSSRDSATLGLHISCLP